MVEKDGDLDEPELTPDQKRIAELEMKLQVTQEDAVKQAAVTARAYVDALQEQKDKLAKLTKSRNKAIVKAVEVAAVDWTEGISLRVAALPLSWSPFMVAKKIRDPEFVHPRGVADFIPSTDDNGNLRRWDGVMVPLV